MKELKDGLSGLMRIKNEASFIEGCITSCIDALDELIIVYNDCTDHTPAIVEQMCKQYPNKIKAFAYDYNILSHNLSKEDFDVAINLPEDSPRLHSTQCNFALSKANYKYAVKIDVDQLYFVDELKEWRNVCSSETQIVWHFSFILGWLFMMYFSVYRRLSALLKKPCLWMLPDKLFYLLTPHYIDYAKWRLKKGTSAIALSGFNVFKDDKWYIPFDGVNIHPPYNGEGDTLIFKISEKTRFFRQVNFSSQTVTEYFYNPYKVMFAGPIWFHLHANRECCWKKVKKVKDEFPGLFVPVENFPLMTYREVHHKIDKKSHTLFQRTLFVFVHKIGINKIINHLYLLR